MLNVTIGLQDEATRLSLEQSGNKEKIKENQEKIKLNKQLPYLVGNVVEILDVNPEDEVSANLGHLAGL